MWCKIFHDVPVLLLEEMILSIKKNISSSKHQKTPSDESRGDFKQIFN